MSAFSTTASFSDAGSEADAQQQHGSSQSQRILCAQYLQGNRGKRDLAQRLRQVVEVLRNDETVEPDSPDLPGLGALCQSLMTSLSHRDKQVRLYTVSACMELFTVYAPDAPWSTQEVLEIFRQTIRQLANLAHTTSRSSPHFADYERILDLLAEVKIAVILVEMTKEDDCREDALPVLAELFQTLLQSVRKEHPPQIPELIQRTLCGCLEEFQNGILVPIPLLDELLICVGQGPRVLVINPQKAVQKKIPLVEQSNPSFLVASSVLRASVDRLATPIASLLNGLLNSDARLMSESKISTQSTKELGKPATQDQDTSADVLNIVYELHRVAPLILTTVIGTLANFLESTQTDQRQSIVILLGKLFTNTRVAQQFRPCFRQWLERSQDKSPEIRQIMVKHLVPFSQHFQEAQSALRTMLEEDPDPQVRLACIHGICDRAYAHPEAISADLLLSVGYKTGTKQKQERKDALTGLVQTYYQHCMVPRLQAVMDGGDDVSLQIVQDTLDDAQTFQSREENYRIKFEWIPNKVFEAASFQDDLDLNARVWQVMDDMLLGSELSSKRHLPSTARAVGLAIILEHLEENALAWLGGMLRDRARLQQKVLEYLNTRPSIRDHQLGSEEHLTANANSLDMLEAVAAIVNFSVGAAGERNPVLEKFHSIRDKHVFRILASIANPAHSTKARLRAVEELPKRLKDHGDAVAKFVRVLVRKCAMGDFMNQEIIHHSILLAQECGVQDDWESCRKLLHCVELAVFHFPDLCADAQDIQNLQELFLTCRASKQKGLDGIVTSLSSILAKAASKDDSKETMSFDSDIQKDLLRLCRDGTAKQARHAARTLTKIVGADSDGLDGLLKSLASPSILSTTSSQWRIVCSFAALSEFAEVAPATMASKTGENAVNFALNTVLLGHGDSGSLASDDTDATSPPKRSRTSVPRKVGIGARKNPGIGGDDTDLLDDDNLSPACRKLCAAIEFLTSVTRARYFDANKFLSQGSTSIARPPGDVLEQLFETYCNILRDGGMPPSKSDRKDWKRHVDYAALRQCAAIHLMRLCDPRLGFDMRLLDTSRWHILASIFLDDDRVVREKVIAELGLMLTGHGKYGKSCGFGMAMPPRPRFLALIVFCTDGDNIHSNGNAANVGKLSSHAKANAMSCVNSMRAKYEVEAEQARANGPAAEQQFERGGMKFSLMPEYVIPYAFHLLAFRKETPMGAHSDAGSDNEEEDSDVESYTESSTESLNRMLRKRLKWLFDPLVHSLGDTADNISFLISISTKLSRCSPVGLSPTITFDSKATSRLQSVCEASRSLLMTSYVKQDVNLAQFPGQVMIPATLFKKVAVKAPKFAGTAASPRLPTLAPRDAASSSLTEGTNVSKDLHESQDSIDTARSSRLKRRGTYDTLPTQQSSEKKRSRGGSDGHVRFSPELSTTEIPVADGSWDLSPIQRKLSVAANDVDFLDSGEKTRGSTPPSAVRDMTFGTVATATQSAPLSASVTQSPTSKASSSNRGAGSRRRSPRLSEVHNTESITKQDRKVSPQKRGTRIKSRKNSVPEQIKIFRHRRQHTEKQVGRKRNVQKNSDDMDFDDAIETKIGDRGSSKNKENNAKPRSSRRRQASTTTA